MRRKVPFIGEQHFTRPDDPSSEAKQARGRIIDDVLSTSSQSSSWDDLVSSDYPDPILAPYRRSRHTPSISIPASKPAKRSGTVPISAGALAGTNNAFKKAAFEVSPGRGGDSSPSMTGSVSDGLSSIDWIPINNGHGLRINICGNLDQSLKAQWRRLLEETEDNGIGQFEFNLTQSPSLSLTGLGMLLMFKEQKGSEKGDIKLCHCNKEVWQLLHWSGMDKYFTIQAIPGVELPN